MKYCLNTANSGVYIDKSDHLPQQWKIFCVKTFMLSVLPMGLGQIYFVHLNYWIVLSKG